MPSVEDKKAKIAPTNRMREKENVYKNRNHRKLKQKKEP